MEIVLNTKIDQIILQYKIALILTKILLKKQQQLQQRVQVQLI